MATTDFVTKDSGARQKFDTGAQRDTSGDKTRFDLIPSKALQRVADLYARGASKYDEWNWAKGIPVSRMLASLERHLHQYKQGDRDEDHLAAVIWNALAVIHYEEFRHLYDDLFDLPNFDALTINDALGIEPEILSGEAIAELRGGDYRDGLIAQQHRDDNDKHARFVRLRNRVIRDEDRHQGLSDPMG